MHTACSCSETHRIASRIKVAQESIGHWDESQRRWLNRHTGDLKWGAPPQLLVSDCRSLHCW